MLSLEKIKSKIKFTNELLTIVRTMKSLAASSISRYQKAYLASEQYFQTIETGMQIVMRYNHKKFSKFIKEEKVGIIIFGSDLGMCGKFNDQISNFAINIMKNELNFDKTKQKLITIGEHITNNFQDQKIEKSLFFPTSLGGIEKVLSLVLVSIEDWVLNQDVHKIVLFYNKPQKDSFYRPTMVEILPLDQKWLNDLMKRPWPKKSLPTIFMDSVEIFSSLVKEYMYISLNQAFIESLLSENISRLASMRFAENNILDHLDELKLFYSQQWQNYITEEILEIEEGYESLRGNQD